MTFTTNLNENFDPIGPYKTSIQVENLIFISGQISKTFNKTQNNIIVQTKEILNNIKSILKNHNAKVKDIIKTTIFLTNLENLDSINSIYKKFFMKYSNQFPTRSCIEVSKLPYNASIEIETIAYKKNR
ncbi:MAG: Rid family detoxifying hydrolase [Buchnera aphidicola (Nurudea ibofushi)]